VAWTVVAGLTTWTAGSEARSLLAFDFFDGLDRVSSCIEELLEEPEAFVEVSNA